MFLGASGASISTDYVFELFESGRHAIDEWTCAVGLSLDHMDYERTRTTAGHQRLVESCQNWARTASPFGSDAEWSGSTWTNNNPVKDHLRREVAIQEQRLPSIRALGIIPEPPRSVDRKSGILVTDYGKPAPPSPLYARWADESIGPALPSLQVLMSQQQPWNASNNIPRIVSPTFIPRVLDSPATTFQGLQIDRECSSSQISCLSPHEQNWAQRSSANQSHLPHIEDRRVPLPITDMVSTGVICEAVQHGTSGRIPGNALHWAHSD